jgi:predicted RNA binding protein YcfA (HicA-like mRNA interferase family)
VSGREFVRVLEKLGYEFVRQRSSHTVRASRRQRKKIPVPCYGNRPLTKGTLAALMREAGITAEELRALLD